MDAYIVAASSVLTVSIVGSLFTASSVSSKWYMDNKPSFTPPRIVFPIVWTVLYVLFAIGFAQSLNHTIGTVPLYVASLVLNVAWSYAFFERNSPRMACAILVGLLCMAWLIVYRAYSVHDWLSFSCVLPYALWLMYALALNVAFALK